MRTTRLINSIIIHCSDSEFGSASLIRSWHLKRGWTDIGYHYVIGNGYPYNSTDEFPLYKGSLEIGRDVHVPGAHCKGMNTHSIGICLIGKETFYTEQYETLINLIKYLKSIYNIRDDYILGHRETKSGMEQGKTCPNFDVKYVRESLESNNLFFPPNFN